MIERLIETLDLKKIHNSVVVKKVLHDIYDKKSYVELVQDKQLLLSLKEFKNEEVLHTDDPVLLNFLRIVRDDAWAWNDLVNIKKSAHKQLLNAFLTSNVFDFFSQRLDKNFLKDSVKVCKKVHDYHKRFKVLHDRLQGVFIVNGDKKQVTSCFDYNDSVITTKVPENFEANNFCWVKEVKYATVVVICPDDNHIFKYLKDNTFEKLTIDKKKSKNIWVKNYK
jgi:hypothetical protein